MNVIFNKQVVFSYFWKQKIIGQMKNSLGTWVYTKYNTDLKTKTCSLFDINSEMSIELIYSNIYPSTHNGQPHGSW